MGCITDPCRIVFNEVIFMMPQKTACIEDGSTKKLLLCSLGKGWKDVIYHIPTTGDISL